MQQMWRYVITGIFLLLCTWQDMKRRKIPVVLAAVYGLAGMLVDIVWGYPLLLCIKGILPGMGLLLLGKATGEQVGYGDGIALLAMGLFLTGEEIMGILLTGIFLCAAAAVALSFAGKIKRKTRLPFLPFLAGGFAIRVALWCTA